MPLPGNSFTTPESNCVSAASENLKREASVAGILIINADDWGADPETTDRIYECLCHGSVSSTSAMVFMSDSERAAALARKNPIDVGLHLNLTAPFTGPGLPASLIRQHAKVIGFLTRNRFARTIFHPGLVHSFRDVVTAQLEEFQRLYGMAPQRIDGHHHMHLCANILLGKLIPSGTIVRRNFSFQPGEKSIANRLYRKATDAILTKRHLMSDYLFPLQPLEPLARLERIVRLAHDCAVELETHPVNADEYQFLVGGGLRNLIGKLPIAPRYQLHLPRA